MAKLLDTEHNTELLLRPEHVFGRQPTQTHTKLNHPVTSRIHAIVHWDGESWRIKDISTNGTFVNASRLSKNEATKLCTNDVIVFGAQNNESFKVMDTSPPKAVLIPQFESDNLIELCEPTCLPSEENPDITVFPTQSGAWACETKEHTFTLKTGDVIGSQKFRWEYVAATPNTQTVTYDRAPGPIHQMRFLFNVSQNEEHVTLHLFFSDEVVDLGERSHHYLLLLLARKRLADIQNGVSPAEQGWYDRDQLNKDLGVTERHSNIQIFRFRKQISDLFSNHHELTKIIERRKGELRFGHSDVRVKGGYQPAMITQTSATKPRVSI